MSKIGSIYLRLDRSFDIGPDVTTGAGPCEKANDYYREAFEQRISYGKSLGCLKGSSSINGADVSLIFLVLLDKNDDEKGETTFGLANRDLGLHNLLIDDDFDVKAMIDIDSVLAAPIELVACLPNKFFSELTSEPSRSFGQAKRIKEYQELLPDQGHPEFIDSQKSPFGGSLAHLNDHDIWAMRNSEDVKVLRAFLRAVCKESHQKLASQDSGDGNYR